MRVWGRSDGEMRDVTGGRDRGGGWARSNVDDGGSRLDGMRRGLQLLLFLNVEDHPLQTKRGDVLLLATAEAG